MLLQERKNYADGEAERRCKRLLRDRGQPAGRPSHEGQEGYRLLPRHTGQGGPGRGAGRRPSNCQGVGLVGFVSLATRIL